MSGCKSRLVAALPLLALCLSTQAAESVDTSNWVCEFCPFEEGLRGEYEAGIGTVSDDTAYLGNATGYDEQGSFANVSGEGGYSGERQQIRWRLEDLGLDSRRIELEGGRPGQFDYRLNWSELPYRQFISTRTAFVDTGNASLVLPADWVQAPTTAGFTGLEDSLQLQRIGSDRQTLAAGGRYQLNAQISVSADATRRSNEGVRITGAPTYTNASLLPAPIDHQTDELELGIRYADAQGFLGLDWYLSDFNNGYDRLSWQQPFSTAPGAESGQFAQAPDNRFQQLRLSGGYSLPAWRTVVSASAAVGRIEQNASFLPYTTNLNLSPEPLPRSSLNGQVDTRNIALAVNSRPLNNVRLRASYRFDERDNQTPVDRYSRVIADTFLSGEGSMNTPFSYRRQNLKGSADWDALDFLRLSSGFEYRDYDRSLQEVTDQQEFLSYGRARLRPVSTVELDGRFGNSRREIDRYDEQLALALGQNPLMRKYNLAYRFREFADLRVNWSPAELPLSLSLTALYADDSYTESQLGLTRGEEQSYTADVNWFVRENVSLYLNAGVEQLESVQLGSSSFGVSDWRAFNDDSSRSWGGGVNINDIGGKLDLRLSAISSRGDSKIAIESPVNGQDDFPDLESELDRLRLDLSYRYSETLDITLATTYQRFKASDWALQGVGPVSVPQLFSLGARPYDEENVIITLGFRYRRASP